MAAAALSVAVPSARLMDLARKFRNQDFLATYTRDVTADAATNHTQAQIMKLVAGLNKTLSNVQGMKTVGQEIALCVRPFLQSQSTTEEEEEDMAALFEFTPHDIKVIETDSKKTMETMTETAVQTREKFKKHNAIDNYETVFYLLICLVRYSPKKNTMDFFYAYVYCRDTSIWQWALNATDKKKRMASLEAEGLEILATALVRNSGGAVKAIRKDEGFEDLNRDLSD